MIRKIDKKGAIELSIGTIVVIVLAMSMLILGIVLIKNIFKGGTEATELLNNNVKAQINKLFNSDQNAKSVVLLPDNQADIKKGQSYNVRFNIRNVVRGESEAGRFTWAVSSTEVETGCQLSLQKADTFIRLGANGGPIPIVAGDEPKEQVIQVMASESAPLCSITYNIVIKKDAEVYDTNFFILKIS